MLRVKLVLLLVFVLLGYPAFLIPKRVLSENVNIKPARITLLNLRQTANHGHFEKSTVTFRRNTIYDAVSGPGNDWDLRYGGLDFNGDRDWFIVPYNRRDWSRIRDLGQRDWSDDLAVSVLPILPCRTKERCGRILIPPVASGRKIQDEDVNPHIAKPVVGHMYLVHTHRERKPFNQSAADNFLDFYTLVRVEELKPNESCTITWKGIPPPKK